MDKIEISGSRKKILIFMLGALFFVLFGSLGSISPETFVSTIFSNVSFIRITSALAALFFALCFSFLVKVFFTKKMNVIINEEGIFDNSSYASVGMIKWEDIISIKHSTVMSQKLLFIKIKNPDDYINSQSIIKKMLLKINLKIYDTPIILSSNALNCNFNKLEEIIVNYFNFSIGRCPHRPKIN
jgi:hypothetical protein